MFKKILVPLDGSPLAADALLPACALAKQCHAELVLAGASSTANTTELAAYLTTMVGCLRADGLLAQAITPSEEEEESVAGEAEGVQADLIVMAYHEATSLDDQLHSSITWRVLAQTNAPVLICKYADKEQAASVLHQLRFIADATAPIVVPLDSLQETGRVLPLAREVAEAFGNPLVLVCAGDPLLLAEGPGTLDLAPGGAAGYWLNETNIYLEEQEQELSRAGLRATHVAKIGTEAEVLQAAAKEYQAGLIVMASPACGWLGRLLLGSIVRSVLSQTKTPLLLVRRSIPVEDRKIEEARIEGVLVEIDAR